MVNFEKNFKHWLENTKKKKDGNCYAESSRKIFCSILKTGLSKLHNNHLYKDINIFEQNLNEFKKIYNILLDEHDITEIEDFKNALEIYMEFLEHMEKDKDNFLPSLIKLYSHHKQTDNYKEQYKYNYAFQNKGIFDDLSDLKNKIKGLGNPNFNSYFIGRCSGLRHLVEHHLEKLSQALSVLFSNDDLKNRLITFKDILNEELKNDPEWHNNNILVDIQTASYFLFTNDYENHLLFTKTSPYNKFAKMLNLTKLLKYNSEEERYINWQEYCQNELLPEMDKVLNKKHTLLDTQDFVWFIGNSDEIKISNDKQSKGEKMQSNIPLNQILYGPPGTGKTYNTIIEAMKIIDENLIEFDVDKNCINYSVVKNEFDKYKDEGRIQFVTFHQSYSYEEFIEGIKPKTENGQIVYDVQDGIFKKLCDKAKMPIVETLNNDFLLNKNPKIWKISLMKTGDNPIRKDCMENNYIRIGFDKYGEVINDETVFDDGGSRVLPAFIEKMEIGDIVLSCYTEKTIDAIGVITSDYKWNNNFNTHKRYRDVKWLAKGINEDILELNNGSKFTLGTVYQLNIGLERILEIVNKNQEVASVKTNQKPYVLIIDEINRGNISKIFGELITLIEDDKRLGADNELTVQLPYSQKPFGVPKNLYIIGTMNTSDRSIALLDTALRRRFDFIEMPPKSELLKGIGDKFGIDFEKLLNEINSKIEDKDRHIGHSYLINIENENDLKRAFKNKIIPLLNEYYYNDQDEVKNILNCCDEAKKVMEIVNK